MRSLRHQAQNYSQLVIVSSMLIVAGIIVVDIGRHSSDHLVSDLVVRTSSKQFLASEMDGFGCFRGIRGLWVRSGLDSG